MDDKPVRPKRAKVHPILLSLYLWYTWALVKAKVTKNVFMYYSGVYMPLWLVTVLVGYHNMDKQIMEDEDGKKHMVHFRRIEYVANETFIHVDLSSESSSENDSDSSDEKKELVKTEPIVVNWRYNYDITARGLWYLNFIDDSYSGFLEYAVACLPFDLNEHKFKHDDNSISFKYITQSKDEPSPSYRELVINNREKYHTVMNNLCSDWSGVMFNTLKFT